MTTGLSRRKRLRGSAAYAAPLGLALCALDPATAQAPPEQVAQQSTAATSGAGVQQVYEPAFFARFAPKTAADMVNNIPGFDISGNDDDERGFGQAKQNVLINGRRVSGKSNDAQTALGRITAENVIRIEIVDGATLNIPGLSGQVANIVSKVDAFSGTWDQRSEFRENMAPTFLTGGLNANGKAGGWSWSLGLRTQEFNNGHDGPTWITNGAGALIDERKEDFYGQGNEPSLSGTVSYETVAGSIVNLNVAANSFNFIGREDSYRRPVNDRFRNNFFHIGEDDRGGELGADWEFDLGPGRLKLIGLQRYAEEDDLFTSEDWFSLTDVEGERSDSHYITSESIGRGEYGFALFGGDAQVAAETAFNSLEVDTQVGERQLDGSYVLEGFFGGSGTVEERRAETNLSYSRKLSDRWSLQSSLGVEYSEISVKFDQAPLGQTQESLARREPPAGEFVRPKGFLALVWKASDDLDVSLKAERKVGQLDFGQFVASVDVQDQNNNSQNPELVPEQYWIGSAQLNQKLGKWGGVKLALEGRLIEDVIDQKLIPQLNVPEAQWPSGVGNIGEASLWSISTSGTINFDPIGWKGLQFIFNWRYADSEVDDPLTGVPRKLADFDILAGDMSLRWDIPDTSWTLVAGLEELYESATYRFEQVSYEWSAPSVNFFSIENKDVFGTKVRLQVVNTNDTSENTRRTVYSGSPRRRTNPVDFVEEAHRTFGPIVRLSVSGTF
jgi:outer membrane receptor for ferrienterochelin and colicins